MALHVFTRQQIYDRVWAEPTRQVAQGLGVSDVGLAKACRAADIPLPPRGYWAKLQHNKPLPPRPPLPRPSKEPDRVVIAPPRPKPEPSTAVAAVAATAIDAAPIVVPEDLRGAHPIVRAMVANAAARRRANRGDAWALGEIPDLETPLAERRLRITSALLKALERNKRVVAGAHNELTVTANGETLTFTLYERRKIELRAATTEELRWQPERKTVRASVSAGDLVLKIRDHLSVPTEFKELKVPLEGQLLAIVSSLEAGLVEMAERRQQRALDAERWAAAERVRKKRTAMRRRRRRKGSAFSNRPPAINRRKRSGPMWRRWTDHARLRSRTIAAGATGPWRRLTSWTHWRMDRRRFRGWLRSRPGIGAAIRQAHSNRTRLTHDMRSLRSPNSVAGCAFHRAT